MYILTINPNNKTKKCFNFDVSLSNYSFPIVYFHLEQSESADACTLKAQLLYGTETNFIKLFFETHYK